MGTAVEIIHSNLRRYTFESPKIKTWVENNSFGKVLNLFAGKTLLSVNEIRNDIDDDMLAEYHKDALTFILEWGGCKFDTVILDPPYSYRKAMEMYKGNYSSRFKRLADSMSKIVQSKGKVISFGYHSTFMGKKRDYDLNRLCVFAHGGSQHCTIGIVEQKR